MKNEKDYKEGIYYDTLRIISPKTKSFDIWVFSKGLELAGLHQEGVLTFLTERGYFKRRVSNGITFSRITENIVEDVLIDEIKDFIKQYVWSIESPVKIFSSENDKEGRTIEASQFRNVFLNQQYNIFNNGFLSNLQLESRSILRDTKDKAYMLFKNKVVEITSNNYKYVSYADIKDFLIFKSQIIDRDFEFEDNWKDCVFAKFVKNISNDLIGRKNAIRSGIGYLLHRYNDPAKSQAVILYDEELTNNNTPKGGTGKGLIAKAISYTNRGFVTIDGKGIKLGSQFLFQQIKEDTRVVFIDDVTKSFDFDRLNSALTEGINVEKKFKETYHIPKDEMPKFLIASNVILDFEGTTRKRRQFIIQLSNHYSQKLNIGIEQPILEEHKVMFFSDEWNSFEWNGFYSFQIKCIEFYLKNGLGEPPLLNLHVNFLIQKIGERLFYFFKEKGFKKNTNYEVGAMYNEYQNEYIKDEEFTQRRFSDNLSQYLKYSNYQYSFKKGILYIK